jgi:hypothetical protein
MHELPQVGDTMGNFLRDLELLFIFLLTWRFQHAVERRFSVSKIYTVNKSNCNKLLALYFAELRQRQFTKLMKQQQAPTKCSAWARLARQL